MVDDDGRERKTWLYDAAQTPAVGGAQRYALIIDQFEEIITAHPGRWHEREAFFRQLDAAMQADPNLWVVLTLREDYVAALDPYAPLLADRLRARFLMEHMKTEAALDAIRRPAELAGRPFAPGVAEKLVNDLRQIRVAGQENTVAGEYVEPVQLEVVCYQLWENLGRGTGGTHETEGTQITLADLAEAGDVDRALTQFYEETLAVVLADPAAAGVSERQLRTWFDQELITTAGTRGLVHQGEADTGGLPNGVVSALQRSFLVRAETRGGNAWIELVHDRFVEPIRVNNAAWFPMHLSTLQRQAALWDEQGRSSGLLLRDAALAEAELWVAAQDATLEPHEQDFLEACRVAKRTTERERQQGRRIRILAVVAVLVSVLALGTAWLAFEQTQQAIEAQYQAVVSEKKALEAQATAEANSRRAEVGELLAQAENAASTIPERDDLLLLLAQQAITTTYEVNGYATEQARDFLVKAMAAVSPWRPFVSDQDYSYDIAQFAAENTRLGLFDASSSTAVLWNILSGQQIARYDGILDFGVASNDDRFFFTTSVNGEGTQIWNTSDGTAVAELPAGLVYDGALSPDMKKVLTFDYSGRDPLATLWSVDTQERLTDPIVADAPVFSRNSERLWAIGQDGEPLMLDATTGKALALSTGLDRWDQLDLHGNVVIARSSSNGNYSLWNAQTGEALRPFGDAIAIKAVAASPDDDQIVAVSETGGARVLNVDTGTELFSISDGGVAQVKYSNGGKLIATKAVNNGWRVRLASDGQELAELAEAVNVWFDQRDELMLIVNEDRSAQLLKLAAKKRVDLGSVDGSAEDVLVSFSEDNQRLAMLEPKNTVRVWNTSSGTGTFDEETNRDAYRLDFSPNGRYLYTDSEIWDIDGDRELFGDRELWDIDFSQDGAHAIMDFETGQTTVWDTTTHRQMLPLGFEGKFTGVLATQNGNRIHTMGDVFQLWDGITGEEISWDPGLLRWILANDNLVIGLNRDGYYSVRDLIGGAELFTMGEADARFASVSLSDDTRLALVIGADSLGYLWDIEKQKALFTVGQEAIDCGVFSPDGEYVTTVSRVGKLQVWSTAVEGQAAPLPPIAGVDGRACDVVVFSNDSKLLAITFQERQDVTITRIWNIQTGKEVLDEFAPFQSVEFSPSSAFILTKGTNGEQKLWRTESQQQVFPEITDNDRSFCFVPGENDLLTYDCSYDYWPKIGMGGTVWDLQTGEDLVLAEDGTRSVLSWDSPWAVAFSDSASPQVWNLSERKLRYSLPEGVDDGNVAFSPNGAHLVAVDTEQRVAYVYDTDTGRQISMVPMEEGQTLAEPSPDGTLLLVRDEHGADVIDIQTRKKLWRFDTSSSDYSSIEFSPDGRYLIQDGPSRKAIWPATPEWLLEMAASVIQRDPPALTPDERRRYGLD